MSKYSRAEALNLLPRWQKAIQRDTALLNEALADENWYEARRFATNLRWDGSNIASILLDLQRAGLDR